MARYVEDVSLLFGVLSGNSNSSTPNTETNRQSPAGQHVAWYADDTVAPVTKETRLAVETAARALSKAGLAVAERRPPAIERGHDLWSGCWNRLALR